MWSRYAPTAPLLRDLGLACLGAGEQHGPLPGVANRSLSCHGLVFISEGSGTFQADGHAPITITAPAFIRLIPAVGHSYGPGPAGWHEHWVLFTGITVRAYLELGLWDPQHPVVPLSNVPAGLPAIFADLKANLASLSVSSPVTTGLLVQQLIIISGDQRTELSDTISLQLQQIDEHIAEPWSVAERAARIGTTVETLRELVHSATGLNPNEYVLHRRLSRAQTLLAETALPVHRIAHIIGYQDAAYFSRIFTSRIGQSPRSFRHEQSRTTTAGA